MSTTCDIDELLLGQSLTFPFPFHDLTQLHSFFCTAANLQADRGTDLFFCFRSSNQIIFENMIWLGNFHSKSLWSFHSKSQSHSAWGFDRSKSCHYQKWLLHINIGTPQKLKICPFKKLAQPFEKPIFSTFTHWKLHSLIASHIWENHMEIRVLQYF